MPTLGDARNLDVNSVVPIRGGVIIMSYNEVHHLAFIESVEADGIHISEANFSICSLGKRIISFSDSHIIGFYSDIE